MENIGWYSSSNIGVDEDSSDDSQNWDAEADQNDLVGEASWEVSRDARLWRKARLKYAEQQIEEDHITGVFWLFQRAEQQIYSNEAILFVKYLFQ